MIDTMLKSGLMLSGEREPYETCLKILSFQLLERHNMNKIMI